MKEFIITSVIVLLAGALAGVVAGYVINQDTELGAPLNWVQEGRTALPNPTNGAATAGTNGTLFDQTYYFKISSVDQAGGQTMPSEEFTCVVADNLGVATGSCVVTVTVTPEASATYLWVATTSDTYYGYIPTATSSTDVATSTGNLTFGSFKPVNTAYYFNSGIDYDNTFNYKNVTESTLVKTGQTWVHTITYSPTDAAAQGAAIEILDNTTIGSGTSTKFYVPAAAMVPVTVTLDQVFDTGLYVYMSGTTDVNVSVSYK